uniref:Uncharacterized protein n=1 Tax=Glossina austeni TaxID=7395 RepID=A0A1A9UR91_GLOAU
MPSERLLVFVDNHDNQRGHGAAPHMFNFHTTRMPLAIIFTTNSSAVRFRQQMIYVLMYNLVISTRKLDKIAEEGVLIWARFRGELAPRTFKPISCCEHQVLILRCERPRYALFAWTTTLEGGRPFRKPHTSTHSASSTTTMRNDGPLKISFNILVCFVSRQPSVASQNLLAIISEAKLTPTNVSLSIKYSRIPSLSKTIHFLRQVLENEHLKPSGCCSSWLIVSLVSPISSSNDITSISIKALNASTYLIGIHGLAVVNYYRLAFLFALNALYLALQAVETSLMISQTGGSSYFGSSSASDVDEFSVVVAASHIGATSVLLEC